MVTPFDVLFARMVHSVKTRKLQPFGASVLTIEGVLCKTELFILAPSARAKAVRHICLTRLHMLTLGLPRVLASLVIEAGELWLPLGMSSLSIHIKNLLKIRDKYYYTTIWKKMQKNKKLLRKKHKILFEKYAILKQKLLNNKREYSRITVN